MSKYGFNENEVRKTIVTQIDKDGFHKETVIDGKISETSDFSTATVTFTNTNTETDKYFTLIPAISLGSDTINTYDLGLNTYYLQVDPSESVSVQVPLYKGTIDFAVKFDCIDRSTISISGDITQVEIDEVAYQDDENIAHVTYRLTGDASVSILGVGPR